MTYMRPQPMMILGINGLKKLQAGLNSDQSIALRLTARGLEIDDPPGQLDTDATLYSEEWPHLQCPECHGAVLVMAIHGQMIAHGYMRQVSGDRLEATTDAPTRCTKCEWIGTTADAGYTEPADEGEAHEREDEATAVKFAKSLAIQHCCACQDALDVEGGTLDPEARCPVCKLTLAERLKLVDVAKQSSAH